MTDTVLVAVLAKCHCWPLGAGLKVLLALLKYMLLWLFQIQLSDDNEFLHVQKKKSLTFIPGEQCVYRILEDASTSWSFSMLLHDGAALTS